MKEISLIHETRRDSRMNRASVSHFGRSGDLYLMGTNPGRVKTKDFNIDTCRFLARRSALLGEGKDWLAQCQDNITEWDIRLWYW